MIKKLGIFRAAAVFASLIVTLMCVCVPVSADFNPNLSGVYDDYGILSDKEIAEIDALLQETAQTYFMNVAIVLTDEDTAYDYEAYADDCYDEIYGINTDGILMLVNFDPNYVHFSTSGNAIQIYSDNDISAMVQDVGVYLKEKNIYAAAETFVSDIDYYGAGVKEYNFVLLGIMIIVGIAAGIIYFFAIKKSYKNIAPVSAEVYTNNSGTRWIRRDDRFIREYVHKTPIPKDDGGSSTHTSSSGGTHGGGGGSF